MNFVKEHKTLLIIVSIILILFIACFVILYRMFFSYGDNKYGDRLKNVSNLEISNYTVTKIESELSELEKVDSVKYSLNGKLINIIFKVDPELEKDSAKEYGNKVLEYFTEEEKNNYDIQVFMVASKDSEDNKYPIIGYKKALKEAITWSNN